jgi:hypothetical protein
MEERMVAPVMIKEHMEVLGSDDVHVGTVDHLEGRDLVKLTKDDPTSGATPIISFRSRGSTMSTARSI